MAGVFHVEFGINETALTRKLEACDYTTAERLISDNRHVTHLDEGCYQRYPLHIVLCGVDEEGVRSRPRNFYVARLLVECGANVNLRVPTTSFGSEYLSPGKAPLELLVSFYNELTRDQQDAATQPWNQYQPAWDPMYEPVIGLNRHLLTTREEVIEHIIDLAFVFLTNNANPNIRNEEHMTCLHRLAITSQDVRLLCILCEHGANANALDCIGNTPLLALCDLSMTNSYDDNLSLCSDLSLDESGIAVPVHHDTFIYLLHRKDVDVNIQSKRHQTALFHCVIRGDISSCLKLLKRGADPAVKGTVWEDRKTKRQLSPLFLCFVPLPNQLPINWARRSCHVTSSAPRMAQLVDTGFFNRCDIADELATIIDEDFPEFSHLKSLGSLIIPLLFGRITCPLKQLAARVIFEQCLIKNAPSCISQVMPAGDSVQQCYTKDDLAHADTYEEYLSLALNKTVLKCLIKNLGLPVNSLLHFELEFLLCRLACRLSHFQAHPPANLFSFEHGDSSVPSDDSDLYTSQDEGDSDLEYW